MWLRLFGLSGFRLATLEGGLFRICGLKTIDFCFPVFAADFITRFRLLEADGFADVIGAVDFVLTVFVDPDSSILSFEDDFNRQGTFRFGVFAVRALEALSNPKVNCSASTLLAGSLTGLSSASPLLLAGRASPSPERGTSQGMVKPTTCTFLASTTSLPEATCVCSGASSRRIALGASLVRCRVTRVEGLPTAKPTNVAVRGSFQATTP